MNFHFPCPYCGQPIESASDIVGSSAICSRCSQTTTIPAHPNTDETPPLAFAWWPRSRVGATIVAVVLVFVFLESITGGFFGALFSVGFAFLILTAIRYGLHRLRPSTHQPTPSLTPSPYTPLWRHPVTIGISGCCLLFLLIALHSSEKSDGTKRQVGTKIQQVDAAWADYNGTGKQALRGAGYIASVYNGDIDGLQRRLNDVDTNKRAFEEHKRQLQEQYNGAQSNRDAAGVVIFASFCILLSLGGSLLFRHFRNRLRKKTTA